MKQDNLTTGKLPMPPNKSQPDQPDYYASMQRKNEEEAKAGREMLKHPLSLEQMRAQSKTMDEQFRKGQEELRRRTDRQ